MAEGSHGWEKVKKALQTVAMWSIGSVLVCSVFSLTGCDKGGEEGMAASQAEKAHSPNETAPKLEGEGERRSPDDGDTEPSPAANEKPEVVSVRLDPMPAYPGTSLEAEVNATDPDGDIVRLEYQWKRNGEVIFGERQSALMTEDFEKGDLITVVVTPFDGKSSGEAVESNPLLLHNRPPEIISYPSADVGDGKYVYNVEATDPDGDELRFSLESAPEGMSIDESTGRLEWPVGEDDAGDYKARIIVDDGDAKAYQSINLSIAVQ